MSNIIPVDFKKRETEYELFDSPMVTITGFDFTRNPYTQTAVFDYTSVSMFEEAEEALNAFLVTGVKLHENTIKDIRALHHLTGAILQEQDNGA